MRAIKLVSEGLKRQDIDARNDLSKRLKKNSAKVLFKRLSDAKVEKDVEDAWKSIFSDFYIKGDTKDDFQLSSPFNTDGFISMNQSSLVFALRILMEFKQKTDLKKSYDRCRIAVQIVHYMKNFLDAGYELPTVLVGADESQAFILLASNFYKYLKRNYNWNCSPSSAYKDDPELMRDLSADANMNVFPFEIMMGDFKQRYNSLLSLFESIESIVQSNDHEVLKVKVTPANIVSMFDEFSKIAYREESKVSPVESVNIFMQLLTASNNYKYYFIPSNHNLFHLPGDKIIGMYGNRVEAFFNHYDRNLSFNEIDTLKAIADRLIEATERRFKGDYWTPSIWAHRADEMLKETLGENYKDEYLVWDCAAGVRNLTRDFMYRNLYISTYHEAEVMLGDGYNPEAKEAFQYDFLNDDVYLNPEDNPDPNAWKMPNDLFNELINAQNNGKKILFYTNPPYGTANNVGGKGTAKSGISKNKMNIFMKDNNYGSASQQLYAQFFARIIKLINDFNLQDVTIGFFTNPQLFTGGDYWKKFNKKMFSNFKFEMGNYFNSGEFSDTSDTWPITFSIYKSKDDDEIQNQFKFSVEESELNEKDDNLYINRMGYHVDRIVNGDDSLKKWANIKINSEYMNTPYPQLGSALSISKGKKPRGKLVNGSLGYEVSNSNSVGEGTINGGVWLVTGSAYKANGFNVTPDNFQQAIVNFTARRCIDFKWVDHFDNYVKPNVDSPVYPEFVKDALIFTLFDTKSYQAAYRNEQWTNINVPGKWANQWFWLSKKHMLNLAEQYHYNELYQDLRNDNERYVYNKINELDLSTEAKRVLDAATKVLDDTFQYRQILNDENPDFYLNAWDAGWFQIKKIWTEVHKTYPIPSYDLFKQEFKNLQLKLSNGVYELGMLYKQDL